MDKQELISALAELSEGDARQVFNEARGQDAKTANKTPPTH